MPSLQEECLPPSFKYNDHSCQFGIINTSSLSFFQYKNTKFDFLDYEKIFPLASPDALAGKLYKLYAPAKEALENPGVPLITVYIKFMPTETELIFPKGTKEYLDKNTFPENNSTYYPGDESIPLSLTILPAVKWAFEYHHRNKHDNSKYVYYTIF